MLEIAAAAAAFGLSGGLSPGPLLALVVAEALVRGRAAGLAVAAAPLLTDAPIIIAAVVLLGRIENSQPALGLINLAGGGLLAWWGLAGLRAQPVALDDVPEPGRVRNSLAKGVAVNLLNPSPYVFWLTVGAPMLVRSSEKSFTSAAVFLAVFYTGLVGSKAVLATLAARSRTVLRGRAYLWANRLLALVLLGYAAHFVHTGYVRLSGG
jgi:threonine/homoserine/homoserine lactone efflux protein